MVLKLRDTWAFFLIIICYWEQEPLNSAQKYVDKKVELIKRRILYGAVEPLEDWYEDFLFR